MDVATFEQGAAVGAHDYAEVPNLSEPPLPFELLELLTVAYVLDVFEVFPGSL